MLEQNKELYKISMSTGKLQVWKGWVEDSKVFCCYGQEGGKMTTSDYEVIAKNLGRSNETSASQQALIELQAMYEDQVTNKHYRHTKEEAVKLKDNNREPRKITNYKDRYNKMSKELLSSVKKNGSRGCVIEGSFYSKIGRPEEIKVVHLKEAVDKLKGLATFDSEVYAEGLNLQRIRSAWLKPVKTDKEIIKVAKDRAKKLGDTLPKGLKVEEAILYLGYNPNEDAPKLKFFVFDIPVTTDEIYLERIAMMKSFEGFVVERGLSDCFEFLYPMLTKSHEERLLLRDKVVAEGNEGLVHYEPLGVYEFGKRSTNTAKDKPRYDSEAFVEKVTKDKSGDGVLHCRAADVLDKVKFKCKMKVERRDGKRYERDFETMEALIGKWITFSYEELSGTGTPTKPVGEMERDCDNEGNPLN